MKHFFKILFSRNHSWGHWFTRDMGTRIRVRYCSCGYEQIEDELL